MISGPESLLCKRKPYVGSETFFECEYEVAFKTRLISLARSVKPSVIMHALKAEQFRTASIEKTPRPMLFTRSDRGYTKSYELMLAARHEPQR